MRYHNGAPLTAEAAAGAINFFLTPEGKATVTGGSVSSYVAGARAVDAMTLEIETKSPDPVLPSAIRSVFVFDPKAWADLGADKFSLSPVGTGPFKVTSWNPESVDLLEFEDAWQKPKVKRLQVIALPEPAARVQALISRQIDLTPYLPIDSIPQVEAAGFKADIFTTPNVFGYAFISTYRDTPFKDKRVRQAVNYAINKQAIVDGLLRGATRPASQAATPQTFGYNPDVKPYPYDPAKAKALLTEAGYPNGIDFDAIVIPNIAAADTDIHQQVAQDLAKVGLRSTVKSQPFAEWLKVYFADVPKEDFGKGWGEKAGTFQLGITLDTFTDPAPRLNNPWSCKAAKIFYCNEKESALLQQASEEFDPEKRKKILQAFQASFHDNAPVVFLVESADIVGRAPNVQNAELIFRVFKYDRIVKAR